MATDPHKKQLNSHIGKYVRSIRQKKGLSREDLAGASNVSLTHLGNIERGTASMTPYTQAKIAKGLKLTNPNELTAEAFEKVYPSMPTYISD
ncbi:helix-turn-helix domain-containing protein [Alkalihalobacillus sp. MEB130]|uniref:helix-turn-helix domain-containing protein n=1 Tax=Alkalihalobacillus sp. MEB130 TaxID=2976704 RepID=UPI0028DE6DB6|nr:helix-turn-helix transcriptional regulator [Alkalihalobacillus sp. MEB130]MDT8863061.1 helix-turn-helix domain-containing protein [Alkalihalobacillus sp. MEB130]